MPRSVCAMPIVIMAAMASMVVLGCGEDETPVTAIDKDPPGNVSTLAATIEEDTLIVLTWMAPGGDGESGRASAYDVRYSSSTINSSNWDQASQIAGEPTPKPAGQSERFVVPGLRPDASYFFCLRTRDDAGNQSTLSNVVLIDVDPPATITDLAVTNLSPRTMTLRWTAPSDNDFSGRPISYDLRSSDQTITSQNWDSATPITNLPAPGLPGNPHELTVEDLEPATHLYFAILSRDLAGNVSELSNVADAITPEGGWTGFGALGTNDQVSSLHSRGTDLVAAGRFTQVGGVQANRIAAWNGQSWAAFGAGLRDAPSPASNEVMTVHQYGTDLVAGGQFGKAGDITIQNLARWDGTAWQHMLGGADALVMTMAEYDGKLFVGGIFYQIGGIPAHAMAYWNGSWWSSMAWRDYPDAYGIRDLALYDGLLIACGNFTRAGPVFAKNIASWNGSEWSALGDGFEGGEFMTNVWAAVEYGGGLIAAGNLQRSGSVPIDQLGRWDGVSWSEFGGGMGSGGAAYISDMIVYEGDLIVAGEFTTIGGQAVNHIARWTGTGWDPMYGGVAGGTTRTLVTALAVHDGCLFVGGEFLYAGGLVSPNIARWDK